MTEDEQLEKITIARDYSSLEGHFKKLMRLFLANTKRRNSHDKK